MARDFKNVTSDIKSMNDDHSIQGILDTSPDIKLRSNFCPKSTEVKFYDADSTNIEPLPRVYSDESRTSTNCRKRKCCPSFENSNNHQSRDSCDVVPTLQVLINDSCKEGSKLKRVAPVLKDILEQVLSVDRLAVEKEEQNFQNVEDRENDDNEMKSLTSVTTLESKILTANNHYFYEINSNDIYNKNSDISDSHENDINDGFVCNLEEEESIHNVSSEENYCKNRDNNPMPSADIVYFENMSNTFRDADLENSKETVYFVQNFNCRDQEDYDMTTDYDVGRSKGSEHFQNNIELGVSNFGAIYACRNEEKFEDNYSYMNVENVNSRTVVDNVENEYHYDDDFSSTLADSKEDAHTMSSFGSKTKNTNSVSIESCRNQNNTNESFDGHDIRKRCEYTSEIVKLLKENYEAKMQNQKLHERVVKYLEDNNISNEEVTDDIEQRYVDYEAKLSLYSRVRDDARASRSGRRPGADDVMNGATTQRQLRATRAEKMAVLQKMFYCLSMRQREVARTICVDEEVMENLLSEEQRFWSELGSTRLLYIRERDRLEKMLCQRDMSRQLRDRNEMLQSNNVNDSIALLRGEKLDQQDLAMYRDVRSLNNFATRDRLSKTSKQVREKKEILSELTADAEDLKERLSALRNEKASVEKEMEKLRNLQNDVEKCELRTRKVKNSATVKERNKIVTTVPREAYKKCTDKIQELTELLSSLKRDFYRNHKHSDETQLPSNNNNNNNSMKFFCNTTNSNNRTSKACMRKQKFKSNNCIQELVCTVEPLSAPPYQARLSRTGLCPSTFSSPIVKKNFNKQNNFDDCINKKEVLNCSMSVNNDTSYKCNSPRISIKSMQIRQSSLTRPSTQRKSLRVVSKSNNDDDIDSHHTNNIDYLKSQSPSCLRSSSLNRNTDFSNKVPNISRLNTCNTNNVKLKNFSAVIKPRNVNSSGVKQRQPWKKY